MDEPLYLRLLAGFDEIGSSFRRLGVLTMSEMNHRVTIRDRSRDDLWHEKVARNHLRSHAGDARGVAETSDGRTKR